MKKAVDGVSLPAANRKHGTSDARKVRHAYRPPNRAAFSGILVGFVLPGSEQMIKYLVEAFFLVDFQSDTKSRLCSTESPSMSRHLLVRETTRKKLFVKKTT